MSEILGGRRQHESEGERAEYKGERCAQRLITATFSIVSAGSYNPNTMSNFVLRSVVVFSVLGLALAFSGQYIPKSFYTIDQQGRKSGVVCLRHKRHSDFGALMRAKRGEPGAFGGGGAAAGQFGEKFFGDFVPNLNLLFRQFQDSFGSSFNQLHSRLAEAADAAQSSGAGAGGKSFAFSSSSNGPNGPVQTYSQHTGNEPGPQVFSRSGEAKGSGVKVMGSAAGPNGAFSSSSSSVDSDGNVKYSVKTGKF